MCSEVLAPEHELLSVAAILGNKHLVKDIPMGILQMEHGDLRNSYPVRCMSGILLVPCTSYKAGMVQKTSPSLELYV